MNCFLESNEVSKSSLLKSVNAFDSQNSNNNNEQKVDEQNEQKNDNNKFKIKQDESEINEDLDSALDGKKNNQLSIQLFFPKWPNRVFAIELIRQIILLCNNLSEELKTLHFDLKKAKQRKQLHKNEDYLILHLSELVRIACISSTSSCDPLRMAGLELIQDIIFYFSKCKEPELPDYLILEQYQAPIGAALKPQFSIETSAYVTALACKVCSSWISCGVAHSLNDLRRVYHLLVFSLQKLMTNSKSVPINAPINAIVPFLNAIGADQSIYSELSSTVEKLAVLRAWAEVIIFN